MRHRARLVLERALVGSGWKLVPDDDAGAVDGDAGDVPYEHTLHDESVPLPPGAEDELRDDNPRLVALRQAYGALDWPVVGRSRWREELVDGWLDLRWFRGDYPFVWHYRESQKVSRLKFFVFLDDVASRDRASLLDRLDEDGAFGCWTHRFAGRPVVSRDLLDSVNELAFLDRHLGLLGQAGVRVLDIGAGYGRLAHRGAVAIAGLDDWCCVDAVPEATFLCEYYVRHRGVAPPVRVVALPDVPALPAGGFDLAVNVHSFSECPLAAIEWWVAQLVRLEVPRLFVVPNEPEGFLSLEVDGGRLDYLTTLTAAGYRCTVDERVFPDDAVRELLEVDDRMCLFERDG